MSTNFISMPNNQFRLVDNGRVANAGKLYIGKANTDPTVAANQITVTGLAIDGTNSILNQPINLDNHGFPLDQLGNVVTLSVDSHYSLAIFDAYNKVQQSVSAVEINEVESFSSLRTLPVLRAGQRVRVKAHTAGTSLGGGEFIGVLGTKADDGGVVASGSGFYWVRVINGVVNVDNFGARGDGSADDTNAILAALNYAIANGISVEFTANKTYKITGSTGLSFDIGKISVGCYNGRAKLDFSGFTGTTAINVYSSLTYPTSMYRNTTNRLIGLEVFGGLTTGVNGLLVGNDTYDYNGQTIIQNCSFFRFDNVVLCAKNTWRTKFIACTISTGISNIFYAPSGILNSGESITFSDCQISDSNNAPFTVACSNFAIGFIGSSVLNTRLVISGSGSVVSIEGMSNFENPNAKNYYRFAEVTGAGARLIISYSTVVCNTPAIQTKPLFYVGANAFIIFNGVKLQGNSYPFESDATGPGNRRWIEGPGFVFATGCTCDILSGAGNIPLHESLSPIRNWDFESGDLSDWAINNSGSSAQTAVVSSTSSKVGTYGLRLTSVSGLNIFATSTFSVKPGRYFATSFWGRVVTANAGATSAGNLTLSFKTDAGVQINALTANLPSSVTDWAVYGAFIQGVVPRGAARAEISLRASQGAVVDFDSVLFNMF